MKRLALVVGSWLVLLSGCTKTPCVTSSECGSSEQCVAAQCSALSCDSVYFAVDPATGQCTPLAPCGNSDEVRSWMPCDNPCAGKSENQCITDGRCQPAYASTLPAGSDAPAPCFSVDAGTSCGGSAAPKTFAGCSPVPQLKDPCAGHDARACAADSRCEVQHIACDCFSPDMGACDCGNIPGDGTCRRKFCGELNEQDCKERADCTTQSGPVFANGATTPKDEFFGCFERFDQGCSGLKEEDCLRSPSCHAVGSSCFCPANASCACNGGKFLFCELNDGVRHCGGDGDCNSDERCNQDSECPAPGVGGIFTSSSCVGVCVPKGCKGYGETQCNNNHHCQPVYALNCSPYSGGGGGGGPGGPGGFCGGPAPGPNEGAPAPNSCTCEPSFSSCEEAGEGCDPEKSVLIRDPAILDDPFWAFPRVLGLVTGGDPSAVSDHLLAQIGTAGTVGGKASPARPAAKAFLDALPRRADGLIDAARIPLAPTALSNRLDLSDATSCGEARITYAITVGVTDRRHRMTLIVELNQPYDNAGCRTVARTWVALSKLDGPALQAALQAITRRF